MKDIYYKSSEGVIINLIQNPYMMLDDTDLFNWKWDYVTTGNNYPYITAFTHNMIERQFNLVISGSSESDMLDNIEHFVAVVDRDVRLNKAGKLYYGDYYREVFFTEHTKGKFLKKNISTHGFTIVAENGDWKSEQLSTYEGLSGGEYLNQYAVPEVSSNKEDYNYGDSEGVEGSVLLDPRYSSYVDIGSADTFILKGYNYTVDYKLPNGSWVNVSEFPHEIDVSSVPLYSYSGGRLSPSKIELHSSSGTLDYETVASENSTTIDWQHDSEDTRPILIIDLGVAVTLKEITGLDIGQGRTPESNKHVYLSISANGEDWTTVDSETIPSSLGSTVTLNHTWSSDYPLVRYIRVGSEPISGSTTNFASYRVETKHFKIKAHFEGENQNLATSITVPYAQGQQYYVDEYGKVHFYRRFGSQFEYLDMTLSNTSTIVAINNLKITNESSSSKTIKFKNDTTVIDSVTVDANSIENYTWSGEEELSVLTIIGASNVVLESSDLEILEEQTVAPHRYVLNDNYVPSDAIIRINGPTTSPSIMIGNNQYGAENETLSSDETLVINTKDETIRHYTDSEGFTNVFYKRLDNTFEKIDVGSQEITWEGNIRVDVELLNSRSDPKWN